MLKEGNMNRDNLQKAKGLEILIQNENTRLTKLKVWSFDLYLKGGFGELEYDLDLLLNSIQLGQLEIDSVYLKQQIAKTKEKCVKRHINLIKGIMFNGKLSKEEAMANSRLETAIELIEI